MQYQKLFLNRNIRAMEQIVIRPSTLNMFEDEPLNLVSKGGGCMSVCETWF